MNNIGNKIYKTISLLKIKDEEKENIIFIIKKITNIILNKKDIVFKNNVLIIKLLGPKRIRIIDKQNEIILSLKNEFNIIISDIK